MDLFEFPQSIKHFAKLLNSGLWGRVIPSHDFAVLATEVAHDQLQLDHVQRQEAKRIILAVTNAPDDPLGDELRYILDNQFGFQIYVRIKSRPGPFTREIQFYINFEEILFGILNESKYFDWLFVFYQITSHVSFFEFESAFSYDFFKLEEILSSSFLESLSAVTSST